MTMLKFRLKTAAIGALALAASALTASAGEVTLWSWRTEDQAAMEKIFAAFTAKNPDVTVKLQFTPDADYQNRLSTALRGGKGPDIAQLKAYGELQPLIDGGYLDALDDSVPQLKEFGEAALGGSRSVVDGKLYGVPYSTPVMGVFYNTEIFEKNGIAVPKTYPDFLAACEKLKAAGVLPIAAGGANGSAWALEISVGVVGPTVYGGGFYDEMMSGKANRSALRRGAGPGQGAAALLFGRFRRRRLHHGDAAVHLRQGGDVPRRRLGKRLVQGPEPRSEVLDLPVPGRQG